MSNAPEPMTKANLARLCNVTAGTVRYWCNVLYLEKLEPMGYRKTQKVFTPHQWKYLTGTLDC